MPHYCEYRNGLSYCTQNTWKQQRDCLYAPAVGYTEQTPKKCKWVREDGTCACWQANDRARAEANQ